MKTFSKRIAHLGTENAFSVIEKAKKFEEEVLKPKGKHLIYLQIGEPSFNAPKNINDAAIKAIKNKKVDNITDINLKEHYNHIIVEEALSEKDMVAWKCSSCGEEIEGQLITEQ